MQADNEIKKIFKQYPDISESKISELHDYLKFVDEGSAFEALSQLIKIAQEYKNNGFKKVDGVYLPEKGQGTINAMVGMQKKVNDMLDFMESIPATDMSQFNNSYYLDMTLAQNRNDVTSVGGGDNVMSFKDVLKTAHKNIEEVINDQKNHTAGSTNTHRSIAAKEVAEVIKNVMGKKVSTTLETSLKPNSKPGSALYCKTLRLTLALVNDSSADYQKLISSGISLLNDKSLPEK